MACNFTKVVTFLAEKRRTTTIFSYLRRKPNWLDVFVNHISTDPIQKLLISMLMIEDRAHAQHSWSSNLVPLLTAKMARANDSEMEGIRNFLEEVNQKLSQASVSNNVLTPPFYTPLLNKAFSPNTSSVYAIGAVCELLKLVPPASQAYGSLEEDTPTIIHELISQEKRYCKGLYDMLNSNPRIVSVSCGRRNPTLGILRLTCIQCVMSLLETNYSRLDQALLRQNVLQKCIDLFFSMDWNNILHHLIKDLVLCILQRKDDKFLLAFLDNSRLLERLATEFQKGKEKLSCMGLIAKAIIKIAPSSVDLKNKVNNTPQWTAVVQYIEKETNQAKWIHSPTGARFR